MPRVPTLDASDAAHQAALKLAQDMAGSRYFRVLHDYLLFRREALFQTVPQTERESARRDGAIEEITKLLQAPELLAAYETEKAKQTDHRAEARAANVRTQAGPSWLGVGQGDGADLT